MKCVFCTLRHKQVAASIKIIAHLEGLHSNIYQQKLFKEKKSCGKHENMQYIIIVMVYCISLHALIHARWRAYRLHGNFIQCDYCFCNHLANITYNSEVINGIHCCHGLWDYLWIHFTAHLFTQYFLLTLQINQINHLHFIFWSLHFLTTKCIYWSLHFLKLFASII